MTPPAMTQLATAQSAMAPSAATRSGGVLSAMTPPVMTVMTQSAVTHGQGRGRVPPPLHTHTPLASVAHPPLPPLPARSSQTLAKRLSRPLSAWSNACRMLVLRPVAAGARLTGGAVVVVVGGGVEVPVRPRCAEQVLLKRWSTDQTVSAAPCQRTARSTLSRCKSGVNRARG